MRGSVIVTLIIVLIVLIGTAFFLTNPEAGQQLLVDLGLAEPEAEVYTASGVLEVPMVALGSEVGGRVEALPLSEGEPVLAGDVVAILSSDMLEAQRKVLQARVDAAQAQVEMLQALPRDVDLAVAEAGVALAQAALDGANLALDDALALNSQLSTRDELIELAEAQVDQADAGFAGAQAVLQALEAGPGDVLLLPAQAEFDAAEAELEAIDRRIANQSIRSPIDGVVMEQLVLVGELALPGWPLVLVADLSEVELVVYIPEADLNWVSLGQQVSVRVDAYPERNFEGEVTYIADEAEFTPRNIQTPNERVILVYAVTIRVPNPDRALKPGLPADATFEVLP
ncbi:MAG TPA: HlyD family efflux transporter periplasmic adaptor subunit [Anaerolineae bacterium]|nr:HlyD family efflux transporter periplasmic adaptor subunit [Anaerolineae bacterium]